MMDNLTNREEQLEVAIKSIKDLIEGRLSSKAVIDLWDVTMRDKIFKEPYHVLSHYFADEDIRKKDPKYSALQTRELKDCLENLCRIKFRKENEDL